MLNCAVLVSALLISSHLCLASESLVRIAVVGDHMSGKTALINRYFENEYKPQVSSAIGIEMRTAQKNILQCDTKIAALESPGFLRYMEIYLALLPPVDAVYYVYDAESEESYQTLEKLIKKVEIALGDREVTKVLVAAKSDSKSIQVSVDKGQELAQSIDADFFTVSALTGEQVQESFNALVAKVVRDNTVSVNGGDTFPHAAMENNATDLGLSWVKKLLRYVSGSKNQLNGSSAKRTLIIN